MTAATTPIPWLLLIAIGVVVIVRLYLEGRDLLDDAREDLERRRRIEASEELARRVERDFRSAHRILEHPQVMAAVDELTAKRNSRPTGNVYRLYDREDDRPVA